MAAAGEDASVSSAADVRGPTREITMEEKGDRVRSWLNKINWDQPMLEDEVNERIIDILYELVEINEARDWDVSLLITDIEEQATEYRNEANYLWGVLEDCLGLSIGSLPSEVNDYLSFIVDSAMTLETKDTSLASLFCAINDMTADLYVAEFANRETKREVESMYKKLCGAMALEEQLRGELKKAQRCLERANLKSDVWSMQLNFLDVKASELQAKIQLAEDQLTAQGWDKSLTHKSLLRLSEKLAKLWEDDAHLKQELENFHHLTPNPFLVKVRIEEVRRELKTLEEEFLKHVTMLTVEMQEPIKSSLT